MTVLIIEDHRELAQWMSVELTHAGWQVDVAYSAAQALTAARQQVFDAILIDIGLPDEDGFSLCRKLKSFTRAAILMVTARQEISDRVKALDGGADDYVAKPFAIEELLARMRAVLRRTQAISGPVLEIGTVRLWPHEYRVEKNGQPLPIGRREFDLLAVFMHNPRRVLTRAELLEKAWGYDFYGESNVVDVTVRRLRERLGEDSRIEIVAVRGVGYSLRIQQ